jgi:hypothetical protein
MRISDFEKRVMGDIVIVSLIVGLMIWLDSLRSE